MEAYYPGPDQVDVLGCSAYNWGTTRPWSEWTPFRDLMRVPYQRLARFGPQPIWVCETGCTPEGGDKPAWVRGMLASAKAFPRLDARAVVQHRQGNGLAGDRAPGGRRRFPGRKARPRLIPPD